MNPRVKILLTMIVLASLTACATVPPKNIGAAADNATAQGSVSDSAAQTKAGERPDTYSLGPDDVVRVTVEQHPEWSGEFPIRPDGNIFVPGIGDFRVQGLTRETASIALATHLEEYINNPRVSVEIVRYASQVIYVLGEVERPGRYSTEGKNVTLRDAVILAGLPRRFAAIGRVYVISPSYTGKPYQKIVNLKRVLNRGELRQNIQLNPGDIVYVPQSLIGMISDFVSAILSPITSSYPAAHAMVVP